jgi:hypothetical protein
MLALMFAVILGVAFIAWLLASWFDELHPTAPEPWTDPEPD